MKQERQPRGFRWIAVGQVLLWAAIAGGAFLLLAKSVQNSSEFGRLQLWILGVEQGWISPQVLPSPQFVFETLHVRYPAVRGARYPTQFLSFRAEAGALIPVVDTVEIEVVNMDSTCTVPAGTFACVHYRGRAHGEVFADAYYAPGVGYLGSTTVASRTVGGADQIVVSARRLAAYILH